MSAATGGTRHEVGGARRDRADAWTASGGRRREDVPVPAAGDGRHGVLGLAVAVVHEVLRVVDGNCWQTSLSGYYHTPVQNLLVGALVAIGVCLVALKGNTDAEDVLLNSAGICAPFVALVPLPDPGACGVVTDGLNRDLNLDNNVVALLAVIGRSAGGPGGVLVPQPSPAGRTGPDPHRASWATPRRSSSSPRPPAPSG